MAYREPPGAAAGPEATRAYLLDLAARREFRQFDADEASAPPPAAYYPPATAAPDEPELLLHPLQGFVERMMAPESPVPRCLLGWETGSGKTIAAITIAQRYAHLYRLQGRGGGGDAPRVFVVGFTRSVFQAEMLRNPRHGFVTPSELQTLRALRQRAVAARGTPAAAELARQYNGYLGTMRRLLTDPARGGYYQFFGYKELANALFRVTPAGEAAGLHVLDLYVRGDKARAGDKARDPQEDESEAADVPQVELFARRVLAAERRGYLRVDDALRDRFRGGLIVADEIHDVYNSSDPNMYGVAIQFLLDTLGAAAPRAVFMSATPVTGHPGEIVDLLNLLVPRAALPEGRPLRRGDLFDSAARLRPGAAALITQLGTGRVSFLRAPSGAPDDQFPAREFLGEPLVGSDGLPIPYLRAVPTPLAPLQQAALRDWAARGGGGALPTPADYALYDLALERDGAPLYTADDLREALPRAGARLALPALAEVSGKYAEFARRVRATVGARPGKILAYHGRVQLTGVALAGEVLRRNGFVELGGVPGPATLCSACGVVMRDHKKPCEFRPAHYALLTGALDPGAKERLLTLFNSAANIDGHLLRVLVGSDVIVQSLDFKAVRFQHLLSVPRNFALLVQILGRASRLGAHAALPPAERRVEVCLYVATAAVAAPGGPVQPPDLVKLTRKAREYPVIQEALAALWRSAVNGFLRQTAGAASAPASLTGVPFELPLPSAEAAALPVAETTYYAFGAADQNVGRAAAAARALLTARPVWEARALRAAIGAPGGPGSASVAAATLDEGVAALALAALARPPVGAAGAAAAHLRAPDGSLRRVVAVSDGADEYYLAVPLVRGEPVVDVESYLRGDAFGGGGLRVSLRDYARAHLEGRAHARAVDAFLGVLAGKLAEAGHGAQRVLRVAIAEAPAAVHYALLEECVAAGGPGGLRRKNAGALAALAAAYLRFRVLFSGKDVAAAVAGSEHATLAGAGRAREWAAYAAADAVRLASGAALPTALFGLDARRPENDIVVGFVEEQRGAVRFKLREPLQRLQRLQVRDVRSLARGAVCGTRSRAVLLELSRRLGGGKGSSAELCADIRDSLLAREEASRRGGRGVRWFYFFNESPPVVAPGGAN